MEHSNKKQGRESINNNIWRKRLPHGAYALLAIMFFSIFSVVNVKDAEAVPAFARKYVVVCNACHTRQPRLNPYGQRFMENGYQLPGTADGGRREKHLLGDQANGVSLDDVSNYLAVRLRADIQKANYRSQTGAMRELNVDRDAAEIVVPGTINLFFAGTAARDISFFFEAEYDSQDPAESTLAFERSVLMFDNLGGYQLSSVKLGVFDPSSFFSFPTHRQQLNPVKAIAESNEFPPTIARIPLLPLAFASRMFGLTTGPSKLRTSTTAGGDAFTTTEDGFAIMPLEPYLFNAPYQKGISVYGRPFGNSFLYQLGIAQNKTAEAAPKTRWDQYVMLRYDMQGEYSNFQVSGFYYTAGKAAMPTINMNGTLRYAKNAVDWIRYGVGTRWQYKAWDVYGTVIRDKIDAPDFSGLSAMMGGNSSWETKSSGISIEADYLLNDKWMLGARYDSMNAGGLLRGNTAAPDWNRDMAQDASFIALLAKYYPAPNIGLYARYHHNLESSAKLPTAVNTDNDEHPLSNLASLLSLGVDMAF